MTEADTPDTTIAPAPSVAVTTAAICDITSTINEALADLDGLIELLVMVEEAPEKPDLPNLALRPILATIRRASGNVSTGLDMLDRLDVRS